MNLDAITVEQAKEEILRVVKGHHTSGGKTEMG